MSISFLKLIPWTQSPEYYDRLNLILGFIALVAGIVLIVANLVGLMV